MNKESEKFYNLPKALKENQYLTWSYNTLGSRYNGKEYYLKKTNTNKNKNLVEGEQDKMIEKLKNFESDNSLSDFIKKKTEELSKQHEFFIKQTLVNDLIEAYNGKLNWTEYLKERMDYNDKIREKNNHVFINREENNLSIIYNCELPILDYVSFMIAYNKGESDRFEKNLEEKK